MGKAKVRTISKKTLGILLITPMEILLNFLIWVPFFLLIVCSFYLWSASLQPNWWEAPFGGIANYSKAIHDARFLSSIGRSLLIVVTAVSVEFGIGLGLSLLTRGLSGKKIIVPMLLLPMMLIPVVVGQDFYMLFYSHGPVNYLITLITGTPFDPRWLSSPSLALFVIILADIWQWTPFMFLITYAGYMAIPDELLNAARSLGASELYIFRRIILPSLKNVILIALILRAIECFKIFDVPWVLTGGGPGFSTETLSVYLYVIGFKHWNLGYVSAGAFIIFIAFMLVTRYAARTVLKVGKAGEV